MTNAATLGSFGDASNVGLIFRNKLINGGFDIWQRGTSQTSSGYGSDDRWTNDNSGSTKTASQQTFTVGQTDVPNNPRYWARTVVTTSAGSSNYVVKQQRIENLATLSGQTATISFWAKADATKNIALELAQYFGTGGSPSAEVTAIGVTTCALTTSWKYFTATVSIPSISGKTLGTNNDHGLRVNFWFDAGSTFNARTNSLGQQSGTFDIAQVQLEAGSAATPFEVRPIGLELSLCQRYFYLQKEATSIGYARFGIGLAASGTLGFIVTHIPVMRTYNAPSFSTAGSFALFDGVNLSPATAMGYDTSLSQVMQITVTTSGLTTYRPYQLVANNTTTAFIAYSAEL